MEDLLALLRSISPDPHATGHVTVEAGALRLDPATSQAWLRGHRVDLPPCEFQLLPLMLLHAGRVVTPTQFHQLTWTRQTHSADGLTGHINSLRDRLGDDAQRPRIIVDVPPLGYRLDPPRP